MAIVFMFIGGGAFIVLLSLAISGAMVGDYRALSALGQAAVIPVGLVVLSWVPVLISRAFRWFWRAIGATDYFAGR